MISKKFSINIRKENIVENVKKEALIITDPKKKIYPDMIKLLKEKGYDIKVLKIE